MTLYMKHSYLIKGFTLIELLVVLTLVGITLGAVSFAIGDGGQQRELREEVIKVQRWFDDIQQSAVVGSKTLALQFQNENHLQLVQYWQQEWKPEQSLLTEYSISKRININIISELPESINQAIENTAIVFFPDGEITPFELQFQLIDEVKITLSNWDNPTEIIVVESE